MSEAGRDIRTKLDRLILQGGIARIRLPKQDYVTFKNHMKEYYLSAYGGYVADEEATRLGYENVRYNGMAICLEPHFEQQRRRDRR